MGRKPTWTEAELQLIRDKAAVLKDKDLAQVISTLIGKPVSVQSVRKQRQKLGLAKQSGRGKCAIRTGASNPNTPHTTSTVPTGPTTSVVSSDFVVAPKAELVPTYNVGVDVGEEAPFES